MKTKKDNRCRAKALGPPMKCECGNLANIKYVDSWICERCYRIQRKIFTDKDFFGKKKIEKVVDEVSCVE